MATRFSSPCRAILPKRFSDKEALNLEERAALVQERSLGEQDDEEKDGKHNLQDRCRTSTSGGASPASRGSAFGVGVYGPEHR